MAYRHGLATGQRAWWPRGQGRDAPRLLFPRASESRRRQQRGSRHPLPLSRQAHIREAVQEGAGVLHNAAVRAVLEPAQLGHAADELDQDGHHVRLQGRSPPVQVLQEVGAHVQLHLVPGK